MRLRLCNILYLWLGILAAALLGAWGYYGYLITQGIEPGALQLIYMTLQLFTLEANLDSDAVVPLSLTIARVLCPALLAYASWQTFARLLKDQIRRFKIPFLRRPIVICGLGRRGYFLARSICTDRRAAANLVVVEIDPENPFLNACREWGASLLIGDALDEAMLIQAGAPRASQVFVLTGSDETNLNVSLLLKKLVSEDPDQPRGQVRCVTAIYDRLFNQFTQNRLGSSAAIGFDVFRPNETAARLVFQERPLDGAGIAPTSASTPHLIVCGFGNAGECLALQAARIGQLANGRSVAISIIDHRATPKLELFFQLLPGLKKCATWRAMDLDMQTPAFTDYLKTQADLPEAPLFIAICVNDNVLAARTALRIEKALAGMKATVLVKFQSTTDALAFLETPHPASEPKLFPFGTLDDVCSLSCIADRTIDTLARGIHESYVKQRKEQGKQDDSTQPWENLPRSLRESNRWQADHIPVKIRALGYVLASLDPARESDRITAFTPDEVEILARMEHARWNSERFADDWTLGPRDPKNRVSPYLIPYDDLENSIQEYDREAMRAIPSLLQQVNLGIYRGTRKEEEGV